MLVTFPIVSAVVFFPMLPGRLLNNLQSAHVVLTRQELFQTLYVLFVFLFLYLFAQEKTQHVNFYIHETDHLYSAIFQKNSFTEC